MSNAAILSDCLTPALNSIKIAIL